MRTTFRMTMLMTFLAVVPAAAQESGSSLLQEIRQAARLPTATREARGVGVPERDLQTIFATARELRLPAGGLVDLLSEESNAIRKYGPIDNFGAFVQRKLNAGLRGRELAAAIRTEHAARGVGKRRPADAGKPGEHPGSSGSVGKPGNTGEHGDKPDSPGKSGESGKKGGV
jgi:hypothetical protein